jgi:hypothetical protein
VATLNKEKNGQKKERKKPVKVFTFDTETRGLDGEIFRVGCFDGKQYHDANDFEKIKKILLRNSLTYDVHIYIHNLEFDVSKIVYDIGDEILFNDSLIINGRAAVIKTFYFTFHDSFSLFPMSLDKLCKEFDVKDRKQDLIKILENNPDYHHYLKKRKRTLSIAELNDLDEYEIEELFENLEDLEEIDPEETKNFFFRTVPADDPILNEYLEFDCRSLFEIINTTMEISGLTVDEFLRCPTTASMSMKIFKTLFPDQYETATSSYFKGKNITSEYFLRQGYYGGRVEVFIPELIGGGFHLDKNSMYPDVMRKYQYPTGDYAEHDEHSSEGAFLFYLLTGQGGGFLECEVEIPEMNIPPLPYRDYNLGKLIFPVGTIRGTWAFPELKFAMERGVEIKKYFKAITFERMSSIFIGFVNHFEKLKTENTFDPENPDKKINLAVRQFSKTVMNSLYGKFCTNRERDAYISVKEIPAYLKRARKRKNQSEENLNTIEFFERVLENGTLETEEEYISEGKEFPMMYNHFGVQENLYRFTHTIDPDYIQVQIGAYVTAYARMELYMAMELIEKNGGRVFYTDTDSVVSDINLPAEMRHPTEFGKWDLENKLEWANYLQAKAYIEKTVDGLTNKKLKGVTKSKVNKMTDDDFKFVAAAQKNQDRDRVKIIVPEEEIFNKIKFVQAYKTNQSFEKMNLIQKSITVRGIVDKRIMDYENNTSRPHKYDGEYVNSMESYFTFLDELFDETVAESVDHLKEMTDRGEKMKTPNRNLKTFGIYKNLDPKIRRKYFSTNGTRTVEELAEKYEMMEEDILFSLDNHFSFHFE